VSSCDVVLCSLLFRFESRDWVTHAVWRRIKVNERYWQRWPRILEDSSGNKNKYKNKTRQQNGFDNAFVVCLNSSLATSQTVLHSHAQYRRHLANYIAFFNPVPRHISRPRSSFRSTCNDSYSSYALRYCFMSLGFSYMENWHCISPAAVAIERGSIVDDVSWNEHKKPHH